MVSAPTGQAVTQTLQPVQAATSISGKARPPVIKRKRIALGSHGSPHNRQATPCIEIQAPPNSATKLPEGESPDGDTAAVERGSPLRKQRRDTMPGMN
jgi:hypothetical protein